MLFIRNSTTLAREVMKAKKGTPFLRSFFFATPNEPHEWLRGKDLNQRPSGYNYVGFAKAQLGARSGCCSGATFALRQSTTRIDIKKSSPKTASLMVAGEGFVRSPPLRR